VSQVKSVFRLLSPNDNARVDFVGGPVTQGNFTGSAGDDVLVGTSGDDTMSGLGGSDVLIGAGGNDALDGGGGNDTASFEDQTGDVTASLVDGTATTPTGTSTLISIENLTGGSGDDFLAGGAGANVVNGGAGDDKLNGGDGADVLNGGVDNDNLIGVNGNDTLHGEDGDDSIKGGRGDDIIDGGEGSDTANFAGSKSLVTASLLTNTASGSDSGNDTLIAIENLAGSDKGDILTGDDNANTLDGNNGNDVLDGQGGQDLLIGGNGNDTLNGGDGNDVLRGGKDADTLDGGADDDLFVAGGTDGSGGDTVNGDTGVDTVDYSADTPGVKADLLAGTAKGDNIGKDTLSGIENLIGGSGDDQLTGDDNDNALTGNDGNDTLSGDAGHDVLDGGAGNDILQGDNGDDTLIGGAGTDSLNGGNGIDIADYTGESAAVTADLGTHSASGAGIGTDTFSGIENLVGGSGNDSLTGDSDSNALSGGAGNDILDGGAGDDQLLGDSGDDTILGGTGNDGLNGGTGFNTASYLGIGSGIVVDSTTGMVTGVDAGSDSLINIQQVLGTTSDDRFVSGTGPSTFDGNTGDDVFVGGGAGNDTFIGGAGNDTADYSSVTSHLEVVTSPNVTVTGSGVGTDTLGHDVETYIGGSGTDGISGYNLFETIYCGDGDDFVTVTQGTHTLYGGAGVDGLSYFPAGNKVTINFITGIVEIKGGLGLDHVNGFENASGSQHSDTFIGDANANVFGGQDGNDVLNGGGGNDSLNGGEGFDTVDYSTDTSGVVVNLGTGVADGPTSGHDTLGSIEKLIGSSGNDQITGWFVDNVLDGGAGDDDLIDGFGNDTLTGGAGNDRLIGGADNDVLNGGSGIDTADFSSESAVNASLLSNSATMASGTDTLIDIESLNGSGFDDALTGNGIANVLTGNAGNDLITGNAGNDSLLGGDNSDTLIGGAGADLIDGGNDADILIYSGASDSTGGQYDTINGFDADVDHVDTPATVTGVDAWIKTGALSTASFDGDLAAAVNATTLAASHAVLFTANAGTLSGHTFLVVDVNGSAGYQAGQDLVMDLTNGAHLKALSASDFI
jgi:Ca2+-binding RTX toxin-like protein